MDLVRIHAEYNAARQQFSYVELHPTAQGSVFAKVALQPTSQQFYIAAVYFPADYPNSMPQVFIEKPVIDAFSPHKYKNGNICFLHPSMWNPGAHDLKFVIARTAKWLSKYEIWKQTRRWPGAQVAH
jgi:ubiquitin-protein ligase